jgi:hypothetical protein
VAKWPFQSLEAEMNEVRPEEYLHIFLHDSTPTSIRRAALEEARENRRFEIDLYWRRTAYFWVFIAAAFWGYSALQGEHKIPGDHQIIAFLIACFGFIFSCAWYFVNRGSKFWQQNWELHVDLLEDKVAGPIYKTVIQRTQYDFCNLSGAYPFSVSKLNQLLSLFVAIGWLILITRTFLAIWEIQLNISPRLTSGLVFFGTLAAVGVLACCGRTRDMEGDVNIDKFYQVKRTVDSEEDAVS